MRTKRYCKAAAAALGGAAMVSSAMAFGADWDGSYGRHSDADDHGSLQGKIELLRKKVKYVFVIFHENESFDHYFGTYPGANGLFEAPRGFTPANKTPSFTQRYLDTSLNVKTIKPFLMPQAVLGAGAGKVIPVYPADEISVDHSHQGMANDLDVDAKTGIAANDRYAMDQEGLTTNASGDIVTSTGAAPTSIKLAQAQKAEDDIDHLDCDTIPFMWSWAKHFVLFDNFHQTIVGPSTPNAIAIIAGQSGETQWALHPDEGATVTYANPTFPNPLGASFGSKITPSTSNAYVPIVARSRPVPGLEPRHQQGQTALQLRREPRESGAQSDLRHPAAVVHGVRYRQDHQERPESGGRSARRAGRHSRDRSLQPAREVGLVSAGIRRQRHAGSY